MKHPIFLQLSDIVYIHQRETSLANHSKEIRDFEGLKACVDAPKASFEGKFLMDIFEMAATYISSICIRHPFLDGNKRTAALSALIFLDLNGYNFEETYSEELADQILDFLNKKIDKNKLAHYFKKNSKRK